MITRRDLLMAGGALLCASSLGDEPPARRAPNIVFILADDLGAGDLSCYGRPDYRTPHIDSLCTQGMKLTRAYANSCTCSPTRVALLSGRYQNRLAVGNYDPLLPGMDIGFPTDHPTLASLLRRAGYATALIGKWHLGDLPNYGPLKSGYDEFFGPMGSHLDYFTHDAGALSGARTPDLYENEMLVARQGYATDLFTERAVRFIERHRARPFLLSLHHIAPHWPWQAPNDRGTGRMNDLHYDGGNREIYAAMMQSLDEGVGRVLDVLSRLDLESETIVVFTSDNGGERFSYHWPLRGGKLDLWEGGIRVPAIVRWPGCIASGGVSAQVAISMDWAPTLLAAAGAAVDENYPTDGMDILPVLRGERARASRTLFWRTQWSCAVLQDEWKYVRDEGREFLFNLQDDAMERANLKLRHAGVFADLKRSFEQWNATMAPIPHDAPASRELFRRGEALESLR